MIRSIIASALLLVAILSFRKPKQTASKNFSIQQLAPNVWAAIQNDDGGHAISNAGIVDLGDKTIVFDAFINPDAAAELRIQAEQLTNHKVSFLINSHFHDDHIRGNQSFSGSSIISSEWTKNEMKKAEPEEQDWARKNIQARIEKAKQQLAATPANEKAEYKMWLGYYEAIGQSLPKLKTVLPDITFNDSMRIYGSNSSALLLECKNGHTGSDVVMLLPKEGIAFMGDLLFVEKHPWFSDGDPNSLKTHLQKFYDDASIKKYVPGHGVVAGKQSLQILMQYITDLQQLASNAVKKGEADSVFAKQPVLSQYKNWWYGRFYPENLSFLYGQAKSKK